MVTSDVISRKENLLYKEREVPWNPGGRAETGLEESVSRTLASLFFPPNIFLSWWSSHFPFMTWHLEAPQSPTLLYDNFIHWEVLCLVSAKAIFDWSGFSHVCISKPIHCCQTFLQKCVYVRGSADVEGEENRSQRRNLWAKRSLKYCYCLEGASIKRHNIIPSYGATTS